MRDTSMEDPREVAASKYHLNYIGLDGNIGCMGRAGAEATAGFGFARLTEFPFPPIG